MREPMVAPAAVTFWPLLLALIPAGCAPTAGIAVLPGLPIVCGVTAAMGPGRPAGWRERPPACALPNAGDVALACAVHDVIASPGFVPPVEKDGVWSGGTPTPTYSVAALSCRFTTAERNAAACRFALTTPAGPTALAAAATFEHLFWQDHGPAHHIYGTRWQPARSCLPQEIEGS